MSDTTPQKPVKREAVKDLAQPDERHLVNLHQLTFGADNAEAYWSFAGDKLIMQTNHKPYACDQIEEISAGGGPGKLVSTGKGRTTCSYFLPGDHEIIYASTHAASPTCPTPPDMSKGYNWGLFEYDIYRANADGTNLRRLTDTPGYDAEGTVCPVDGSILFTSERSGDLELWRMDSDGKNPRQLTNLPGYDGGGFFNSDCTKIIWRASRPTGKDLEDYKALLAQHLVRPTKMDLWIANADGTDARQLTYLPGASFGPYFFPDSKRVIFASNYLDPKGPEFDLYAIDVDGTHLERITTAPSFDGFPMFSPDGKRLSFSSNRRDVVKTDKGDVYRLTGGVAGEHDTNVFVAEWKEDIGAARVYQPETAAAERFIRDVRWLADDGRQGRGIGTQGLADAEDYVQRALTEAGAEVTRQPFDVTVALERGPATALAVDGKPVTAEAFTPMRFSGTGSVKGTLADAGWGTTEQDFARVKGKIARVHRFAPPDKDAAKAARAGDLRYKAFLAHQKGAVALVIVDDGDVKQDEAQLPKLAPNGELDPAAIGQTGDAGLPVIVTTRAALPATAKQLAITVELEPKKAQTANVVGVIHAGAHDASKPGIVVIGAHVDHLGMGGGDNALDPKVIAPHGGADDNASGTAALLEVTRVLGSHKAQLARDVYVVAFSGEESGDLGSTYFVQHPPTQEPIVAMLNMDMVGRMRSNHLFVAGGASAKEWATLVQPACDTARVDCSIGGSGYGPSDHMPFYVAGVPVLFFHTGNHLEYHTVKDTADKINAAGGARAAMVVAQVADAVAGGPALTYIKAPPEATGGDVRHIGASLGTVPSYGEDPNQPPGVTLSDVVPDGPAAKAGLKGGDRIINVGGADIRDIHDLMYVLEAAKPGTDTTIVYVRDGKRQTANATFGVPRSRR